MLLLVVIVVALVSVPLVGGSLRRLEGLRFRLGWLVQVALAIQLLITVVDTGMSVDRLRALHLLSYAVLAYALLANRRIPGMPLVLAGLALNVAAITANGGTMPADPGALRRAGIVTDGGFENSAAVPHARLRFLGDVFAVPEGVPFANVFSVGDVLLVAGGVVMIHTTCGSTFWGRVGRRQCGTAGPGVAGPGVAGPGVAGPGSGVVEPDRGVVEEVFADPVAGVEGVAELVDTGEDAGQ